MGSATSTPRAELKDGRYTLEYGDYFGIKKVNATTKYTVSTTIPPSRTPRFEGTWLKGLSPSGLFSPAAGPRPRAAVDAAAAERAAALKTAQEQLENAEELVRQAEMNRREAKTRTQRALAASEQAAAEEKRLQARVTLYKLERDLAPPTEAVVAPAAPAPAAPAPAAPVPKPVVPAEDPSYLRSYYELFDPETRNKIVLIGEAHSKIATERGRVIGKDTAKQLNRILQQYFKDSSPHKTFLLEARVRMDCEPITGGGLFVTDPETGAISIDPSKGLFAEVGVSLKEDTLRLQYLQDVLERNRADVVPFDFRDAVLDRKVTDALMFPDVLVRSLVIGSELSRQDLRQRAVYNFLYTVVVSFLHSLKVFDRSTYAVSSRRSIDGKTKLRKFIEDNLSKYPTILYYFNELVKFIEKFLQDMKFALRQPIAVVERDREGSDRAIDIATIKRIYEAQSIAIRMCDFYALAQIVSHTNATDHLVVVYAGHQHTTFIASMLAMQGTPYTVSSVAKWAKGTGLTLIDKHDPSYKLYDLYKAHDPKDLDLLKFTYSNHGITSYSYFQVEPPKYLIFNLPELSLELIREARMPYGITDIDD